MLVASPVFLRPTRCTGTHWQDVPQAALATGASTIGKRGTTLSFLFVPVLYCDSGKSGMHHNSHYHSRFLSSPYFQRSALINTRQHQRNYEEQPRGAVARPATARVGGRSALVLTAIHQLSHDFQFIVTASFFKDSFAKCCKASNTSASVPAKRP